MPSARRRGTGGRCSAAGEPYGSTTAAICPGRPAREPPPAAHARALSLALHVPSSVSNGWAGTGSGLVGVGRGGRSEDTDEDGELLGEASEEDGEGGDDDKGEADGGGAGPRGPDDAGGDAVADRAAAQQRYETELARLLAA